MANVVKHKKTGDVLMEGELKLKPLVASKVTTPDNITETKYKVLFCDDADGALKTKDSSGTVAAIGGGSSDTIATITTSGDWTVPAGVKLLKDVWIIAGGGGGGVARSGQGAGGGAGGVRRLTNILVTPADTLAAIIGAGGIGGTTDNGTNGGDSSITIEGATYTATGGGYGEGYTNGHAGNGGSGGGHSYGGAGNFGTGIAATLRQINVIEGQGQNGALGANGNAGSGGGYSQPGASPTTTTGANGGNGIDLRLWVGTSIGDSGWFAGGGGGGIYFKVYPLFAQTTGGKGGGGKGGPDTVLNGEAGVTNTGGGGGGGSYKLSVAGNGGSGASGIIIIKY